MHSDYAAFTKEDFLQDEFFIRSVKYPDAYSEKFWNDWMACHSDTSAFTEARSHLQFILCQYISINAPAGANEQVWRNIMNVLPAAVRRATRIRIFRSLAMAASILIVVGVAGMLAYNNYTAEYYAQQTKISVPFAATRSLQLPDSTVITLNANSDLQYFTHWKKGSAREVWLRGEGYFTVKHINKDALRIEKGDPFIVHTSSFDVKVLGTVFNVKARDHGSKVILVSGSVAVRMAHRSEWKIMTEGQEISVDNFNESMRPPQPADISRETAWKNGSVLLPSHSTLESIIPGLEENYGVKIIIASPQLRDRKIEGVLPLGDKKNLFFILKNVMKAEVEDQGSSWIITPAKTN